MHLRDLTRYLEELSENNNRAWFVMNKPRYDILRLEFLELVTRLVADIAKFDPPVASCNPKKALFRINRDIRFAKDKRPYKTTFSAAITASGMKKPSEGGGPAYYFQINAEGMMLFAGGEYMPPPDRLRAIRQAVAADPSGLKRVLRNKKFSETFGGLQDEGKLLRAPKGFDPEHPQIDLIKHKSFIAWTERSVRKMMPETLEKELAVGFKQVFPLVAWLRQVPAAPTDKTTAEKTKAA